MTRTPSISTSVCAASAPRMLRLVSVPSPPLRDTVTPGVVASRSESATVWRCSIVARSITVTAWPTSPASCGTPAAVTTMSSADGVSCANAGLAAIAAVESNNNLKRTICGLPRMRRCARLRAASKRRSLEEKTSPARTTRPREGSTVVGRSPGFRVFAGAPPSRGRNPSGMSGAPAIRSQLRGQHRSCGRTRAPDFPFDPIAGNPSRRGF